MICPVTTLYWSYFLALDRRGTIPLFLQAVRKARPLKNELIQVISECCPGAMSDAAPESEGVEAVEIVSKGMTTLQQMRAGTATAARVNDRVVESRAKLQLPRRDLTSRVPTIVVCKDAR